VNDFPKIAQLKNVDALRKRLNELNLDLPVDDRLVSGPESPLEQTLQVGDFTVGNRWCIHPMEGWDANADGSPSELTLRRWRRFGESGAKWIWGGEAAAVQADGRANPRQTLAIAENRQGLCQLLHVLRKGHQAVGQSLDGLFVGLQLTHSGRFSRPNSTSWEPRIAYHHPLLDEKFGIDPRDDSVVWSDSDLEELIDCYVKAAKISFEVGFQFVDVKSCHGYLLHEFLSARRRTGPFGGDFDGRTRMLRTIVGRIGDEIPDLQVGVRLSVFDSVPYKTSRGMGEPMDSAAVHPYDCGFGVAANDPTQIDLEEPIRLIGVLRSLGVTSINLTAGSPYYNPHVQRPAIFPPSDGYLPPEDPLVGVERQVMAARRCKQAHVDMPMVGTGYSYLQDYLPHVAQATVRKGWIDSVGLGRMVLSYPQLPRDVARGSTWQRKLVCRTFSDCTTAPRNSLVSGCYPLDTFYRNLPDANKLRAIKQALKEGE
jgi:2,4-dienoyl-CoA reductase-like NADH-dependent reductase (Old Yellow Enzyme family)